MKNVGGNSPFLGRRWAHACAPRLRSWVPLLLIALLTAIGAPATPASAAAASGPILNSPNTIRFVKGQILVKPVPGLPAARFKNILKPFGGHPIHSIKDIGVFVVSVPAGSESKVARALSKNPHIKFAELNRVFGPSLTPDDPDYPSEWQMPDIGAPSAWNTSLGNGVTIAILDSGVDPTQPDLQADLVPGYNFYDNNTDTADVYGHGTEVAGAAAAIGNNGIGVAGVAFESKIMPIRVTDTSGYAYASMIASGLTWAADHGARVANLSFQGVAGSSTVLNAASYMRSKGGVVVVAAGNTGTQESYPVSDAVTAVTAVNSSNTVTSWSSYGDFVDVAAPGVGICTTTMSGGYGCVSGTSFASPITAGVYALMMAANPSLQPSQLDSILYSTAKDLGTSGWDQYYGWGLVQASAAVQTAMTTSTTDTTPPTVSITSPTNGSKVSGITAVDVSATDNVGVSKVELYVNNTLLATEVAAPYTFDIDTTQYTDGSTLSLVAKAYDAAGNVGTSSTVDVTVANDTTPPTVTITSPTNGSTVSGTVAINVTATDDTSVAKISLSINGQQVAQSLDSTSLSYSWTVGSGSTKLKSSGKGNGNGKGNGKKTSTSTSTTSSTATISATATDSAGNASTTSITVMTQ